MRRKQRGALSATEWETTRRCVGGETDKRREQYGRLRVDERLEMSDKSTELRDGDSGNLRSGFVPCTARKLPSKSLTQQGIRVQQYNSYTESGLVVKTAEIRPLNLQVKKRKVEVADGTDQMSRAHA